MAELLSLVLLILIISVWILITLLAVPILLGLAILSYIFFGIDFKIVELFEK